ncbi:MAG: cell division protein ZipA C-terminal FtsZ-binding domain-containing protein [Steroidobacteraceae bacterium]|jgi:FtsZ-interacting cell division protein ZipA
MSGLRWILLLTGIVFLIGLAWWERRRQHQARPAPIYGASRTEPVLGDSPMLEPRVRAGEVPRVVPIVDWSQTADERIEEAPEPLAELDAAAPHLESELDEVPLMNAASQDVRVIDLGAPAPEEGPALKMQWPPESERRILALRLVTLRADRLSGRTLRQSLAGCGFRHGPMSIFHLSVPDGRVIMSAANLASPGELDPRTMDFQRYAGINLFAVLPGPLEAEATALRLVRMATEMSRRLDATIQDEEGTAVEPAQLQHLATRLLARANATAGPAD